MARARGPTYRVPFRRRREGKTNYHHRLKLIVSRKPRMVVRRSNRYVRIQLISAEKGGDFTHVAASSSELRNYGYTGSMSNAPAAYLTGLLFGQRVAESDWDELILDKGLQRQVVGGTVYAALRGAVECGLSIPHDPAVFPDDDRVYGKLIADFRKDEKNVEMVKNAKAKIIGARSSGEAREEAEG
jgi:large subunit ribosomal protein L18